MVIIAFVLLARPVLPVLEYVIDYEHIVTELCENKEKPELHCNGKCHLMKELAKASEDEKPLSEKKNLHQETEVLFFQEVNTFTFSFHMGHETVFQAIPYSNLYNSIAAASVFHPPSFIG